MNKLKKSAIISAILVWFCFALLAIGFFMGYTTVLPIEQIAYKFGACAIFCYVIIASIIYLGESE